MKAKLIINDQALEIEISEEELQKLQTAPKKKTGYERVQENNEFYYAPCTGDIEYVQDFYDDYDAMCYNTANYYSSLSVAENNARADQLMRQLRRFAVERRESEIDWNNTHIDKHYIYYNYAYHSLNVCDMWSSKVVGTIYFDSKKTAEAAIDEFHDELIWYFTEYQDSL